MLYSIVYDFRIIKFAIITLLWMLPSLSLDPHLGALRRMLPFSWLLLSQYDSQIDYTYKGE